MKDLSLMVDDDVKLNVRATLIAVNDGKVLLQSPCEIGHYALPGGRVKANEDSITATKREVMEEMGLELENVASIGIIENFFQADGYKYQEYMWMTKGDLKDKTKYKGNIIGHEGEQEQKFEWVDIDNLEKIDFRPESAIPIIKNMDGTIKHIISY